MIASLSLLVVSLWMQPSIRFAFVAAAARCRLMFSLSIRTLWSLSPSVQPKSGEPWGADRLSARFVVLQGGVLLNLAGCHAAVLCHPPRQRAAGHLLRVDEVIAASVRKSLMQPEPQGAVICGLPTPAEQQLLLSRGKCWGLGLGDATSAHAAAPALQICCPPLHVLCICIFQVRLCPAGMGVWKVFS